MDTVSEADLAVIGGGVVGIAAARAFARRHPGARVVVVEKEPALAAHASGRNSGVLHAGFYYPADSYKARFTVEGNRAWRAFCAEHGVAVRACGKLVVPRTDADEAQLDVLFARGAANGAEIERVTAAEAHRIEPRARVAGRALWSPRTAVLDPVQALRALAEDAARSGVEIHLGTSFLRRDGDALVLSSGRLRAGRVLACAGTWADRVAAQWGLGARWTLVPFRGAYLLGEPDAAPLACCIYPVPDPEMPFLGVHLTVTPAGGVKIGPTAMPVRAREDYGRGSAFTWGELAEQVRHQAGLFAREPTFRRHVGSELRKWSRRRLVDEASALATGLSSEQFLRWGKPGIRAQLVDRATGRLASDFVIEEAEGAVHVLNAVSPAFTCALPFAEHLVDRLTASGAGSSRRPGP